jgi:hypothetical protein
MAGKMVARGPENDAWRKNDGGGLNDIASSPLPECCLGTAVETAQITSSTLALRHHDDVRNATTPEPEKISLANGAPKEVLIEWHDIGRYDPCQDVHWFLGPVMRVLIASLLLVGVLGHPCFVNAAEAALNHASLKAVIEGLGYEPKEGKLKGSETSNHQLHINKSPWNDNVTIFVDDKSDVITLSTEFGLYKGASGLIPQSVLLGTPGENASVTWPQFHYLPSTNGFFLLANLRNKYVSAVDLHRVIEEIVAAADRTESFWIPKQWPRQAGVEAAKTGLKTGEETKK